MFFQGRKRGRWKDTGNADFPVVMTDRLVEVPYLLVSHIPLYRDGQGGLWADASWFKDLMRHGVYLSQLTLLTQVIPFAEGDETSGRFEKLPGQPGFAVVEFPSMKSSAEAVARLPKTMSIVLQAVRQTHIVHSCVVGWPYPIGWLAQLGALLYRKRSLVVVESASWRQVRGRDSSLVSRVRAAAFEHAARFFCSRANLLVSTQGEYVKELRSSSSRGLVHVSNATWISERDIWTANEASQSWRRRIEQGRAPVRILFAGRLTREKGVDGLIFLARHIADRKLPVCIDVYGEGEMRPELEGASNVVGSAVLRISKPVAYGPQFMEILEGADIVLVPSLSDEQPRVVFDAYARARGVIAADTSGLTACVEASRTGWIFPKGNWRALCNLVEQLHSNRAELMNTGLAALQEGRRSTHEGMHRERCAAILDMLSQAR
jgi:glycosyltransferase involved in cell wall biosynthesis